MRNTLIIALALACCIPPSFSQDCSKQIIDNKKHSGVHLLVSTNLAIVVRAKYTYQMQIFSNEKGVFARMTSVGGIEFNQDDQVVFFDVAGNERAYRFVNMDEVLPGAVPSHRNNLQIDLEAIDWFSKSTITSIHFINFVSRQKHKFDINANRQQAINQVATCFTTMLDPSSISNTTGASVSRPQPREVATSGTASGGSKTDNETERLKVELENTKTTLRAEIEVERTKAEAQKAQIRQEVIDAREAANKKIAEYAEEVKQARLASQEEIDKANEEAKKYVLSSKMKADSAVSKILLNVEDARKRAGEEIQAARQTSLDEVRKAREKANTEIAAIQNKLDASKAEYASEVSSAKEKANAEILRIREENSQRITEAREKAELEQERSVEDVIRTKTIPLPKKSCGCGKNWLKKLHRHAKPTCWKNNALHWKWQR
ncbi:MAG: hypothetical protein R2792_11000 [Saprospiraceae bacterium]